MILPLKRNYCGVQTRSLTRSWVRMLGLLGRICLENAVNCDTYHMRIESYNRTKPPRMQSPTALTTSRATDWTFSMTTSRAMEWTYSITHCLLFPLIYLAYSLTCYRSCSVSIKIPLTTFTMGLVLWGVSNLCFRS